ncbi:acetylxylan esterase [Gemmatimonadota bacterium]
MIKQTCRLTISVFFISFMLTAKAAAEEQITLEIKPAGEKYLYELGDTVFFNITVKNLKAKKNQARLYYRLSRDEAVTLKEGFLEIADGKTELKGFLEMPGFLRCDLSLTAGSDTLTEACGCGFAVEAIRPTGRLPQDYKRFWYQAKIELLRIPVDAKIEEVEVVHPGDSHRYKVSLAHSDGSRVYGWLHLPRGDGPFPTVLSIPGSGVGRSGRFAKFTEAGFAVFAMEIHGLEPSVEVVGSVSGVVEPDSTILFFRELQNGLLANYHQIGKEDAYHYYHRRSVQAAIRALDFLKARKDVDTTRIAVYGGSQGGGLGIMLAAVDKRVKALVASVPGFCDHTAYLYGRAGNGRGRLSGGGNMNKAILALSYYDAALAAGLVEVPVCIGVGFEDNLCHPTKVYSAFNNLKGSKRIDHFYTRGHASPPEWRGMIIEWLKEQFDI